MYLRAITFALLFSVSGVAKPSTARISVSFYAFDFVAGSESVNLKTGEATFQEIRLSTANIVGPVTCLTTDGKITFHSEPVAGGDGKAIYPLIATGVIKEGISKALVVLFPAAADSGEKYRCIAFNNDLTDFPLGAYRLINLSNKPIRGAVGRGFVETKPGGVANLELKGEPGAIMPLRFEFFEENRWNLLTESRAAVRRDKRWLMCIYQDPKTGRMKMRSIPDRSDLSSVKAP